MIRFFFVFMSLFTFDFYLRNSFNFFFDFLIISGVSVKMDVWVILLRFLLILFLCLLWYIGSLFFCISMSQIFLSRYYRYFHRNIYYSSWEKIVILKYITVEWKHPSGRKYYTIFLIVNARSYPNNWISISINL